MNKIGVALGFTKCDVNKTEYAVVEANLGVREMTVALGKTYLRI